MNRKLYEKVRQLGIEVKHVAEVGVYRPETSNVLGFIEDGVRADLFEPDPECVELIEKRFADHPNVTLYPVAIYHERTKLALYRANASTFVATLEASPALVNDKYKPREEDKFFAEAHLMSEFDDGSIDVLSIDTEGCEWYVLKTLVSRPSVISLETHGKRYKNPFFREIAAWMRDNRYRIWYKDRSDTVFIKNDIPVGFFLRWF